MIPTRQRILQLMRESQDVVSTIGADPMGDVARRARLDAILAEITRLNKEAA